MIFVLSFQPDHLCSRKPTKNIIYISASLRVLCKNHTSILCRLHWPLLHLTQYAELIRRNCSCLSQLPGDPPFLLFPMLLNSYFSRWPNHSITSNSEDNRQSSSMFSVKDSKLQSYFPSYERKKCTSFLGIFQKHQSYAHAFTGA